MCAAHEFEEDGLGFRMGPVTRLSDCGYGIPLFIWDAFTGDQVYSGVLDINYTGTAAEWRSLHR
ncbi:MAG TPA: hypothetical protein VJQ57_15860 [Acidimicrobiia bacterium]|nr:hypothetical protein [Acidimicrobiia bacterium]